MASCDHALGKHNMSAIRSASRMSGQWFVTCNRLESSLRGTRYFGAGACHNSTLFPSGSINHPKVPYSELSGLPASVAPPSITCFNAPSTSSTTRLIMNALFEGSKYLVSASNADHTVTEGGGMASGLKTAPLGYFAGTPSHFLY